MLQPPRPTPPGPVLQPSPPPKPRQRGRRLKVVIASAGAVLVVLMIIGALLPDETVVAACEDCALQAVRLPQINDIAEVEDLLGSTAAFGSDDVVFEVDDPPSGGLSAVWRLGWNDQGLVVLVVVTDEIFEVAHGFDATQVFKGDSVNFEFGPDPRELGRDDSMRVGQDVHMMLGPIGDPDVLAGANVAGTNAQGTVVMRSGGVAFGTVATTREVEGGYVLAALITWDDLRLDGTPPSTDAVFGMNLNVSDGDSVGSRLARMVSNNPARRAEPGEPDDAGQTHPGRWTTVVLVDE